MINKLKKLTRKLQTDHLRIAGFDKKDDVNAADYDVVVDKVNEVIDEVDGLGGGGTPGGADTQVQYNKSGAFDGDIGFTYDDVTKTLNINNGSGNPMITLKFDGGTSGEIIIEGGGEGSGGRTLKVGNGGGGLQCGGSFSYVGELRENDSTRILATQQAAVADASGGSTVDTEARAAINALLARLRTHGLIAT